MFMLLLTLSLPIDASSDVNSGHKFCGRGERQSGTSTKHHTKSSEVGSVPRGRIAEQKFDTSWPNTVLTVKTKKWIPSPPSRLLRPISRVYSNTAAAAAPLSSGEKSRLSSKATYIDEKSSERPLLPSPLKFQERNVVTARELSTITTMTTLGGGASSETSSRHRPVALLSPKMRGIMKYTSFFLLVFQNSALTCTMRWSRTMASGPLYATSTAVVCSEMIKLIISALLLLQEQGSWGAFIDTMRLEVFGKPEECLKLLVPGLLYTVQNNLQYVASSNLEPAVFQVMYQVKMLTTATLSVTMLKKRLRREQWAGVALLTTGLVLVQLSQGGLRSSTAVQTGSFAVGFSAVLTACTMAGFAGCYLERVLKNCTTSIWVRNLQLGAWGSLLGIASVAAKDGKAVLTNGFFHGYSKVVWSVVAIQAIGGLLISLVVRYGDALLKGFATGLAIIVTTAISVALFDFRLTPQYGAGASLVLIAILMYADILPRFVNNISKRFLSEMSSSSTGTSSSSQLLPSRAPSSTSVTMEEETESGVATASFGSNGTADSAVEKKEKEPEKVGEREGMGVPATGVEAESAFPWSKITGGGTSAAPVHSDTKKLGEKAVEDKDPRSR